MSASKGQKYYENFYDKTILKFQQSFKKKSLVK